MQKSPLSAVDLNLLLALEALLAEAHVGRAGRRIGLSASAMSHALARLRSLVGDPLLVRAGQRMALTKRGSELLGPLSESLARIAELLDKNGGSDPARERRTLRIAVSDFALNHVIPPLWQRLTKTAPNVELVVSLFGQNGFKELADGEIDLAIAANRAMHGFHSRLIWQEPFVCLVRRGHPALRAKMTPRRFAELDHVLVSPRGKRLGAVDDALKKKGLKRRVTLIVPTFLAAATALRVGNTVLTCGHRSALDAMRVLELETFEPPLKLADGILRLNWHERQQHDTFLAWLRDEIDGVAAKASGARGCP